MKVTMTVAVTVLPVMMLLLRVKLCRCPGLSELHKGAIPWLAVCKLKLTCWPGSGPVSLIDWWIPMIFSCATREQAT